MRRIGLILFIFVILFNLPFYLQEYKNDCIRIQKTEESLINGGKNKEKKKREKACTQGLVIKNIVEKGKSRQYISDNYIIVDFSKKNKFKIGDIIDLCGYRVDMGDLFIQDFNYGRYLRSQGYTDNIILKDANKISEDKYFSNIGKIKTYISQANRDMYRENSSLLNAMIIADKLGLKDEDRYLFSDTGTSHVMAISGLHIGIIIAILMSLFGRLNRPRNIFLTYLVLYFYNDLIGGGSSITRAIFMCMAGSMTYYLRRDLDIVNFLMILATILVLENKYIIFNISFALSYLSVLSIVVFNKYVEKYVYFNLVCVSISASILTVPLVLLIFHTTSLVSIIGNIILVPLLALIISLDIISVLLYAVFIDIALLISSINNSLLDVVKNILKIVGADGYNNLELRNVDLKFVLFYYIIVFVVALYLEAFYVNKNKFSIDKD